MTIEKIEGKLDKKVIDKFKKEFMQALVSKKRAISDYEKQLSYYKENIIQKMIKINMLRVEYENLKKYTTNINPLIKKQIEEIKSLPFVEDIKITETGIKIDVGKVNILYLQKEVYIGDFIIKITPSGVQIECKNPLLLREDGITYHLAHPHISEEGNICYGDERAEKIEEYFAQFELKKLVLFVYLFLKSYNPNDNYNPITDWTNKNIKRKK
jgi:hypothetical protein